MVLAGCSNSVDGSGADGGASAAGVGAASSGRGEPSSGGRAASGASGTAGSSVAAGGSYSSGSGGLSAGGAIAASGASSGGAPGNGGGGAGGATATGGAGAASSDSDSGVPDAAAPATEPRGIFVAVGYGGRTIRSTDDGITWVDDASLVQSGGDDDKLLRAIVWGGGKFVALGWRVMTSPDGKGFVDHGTTLGQWIGASVYANGGFVAVGGYGLHRVSKDGITWESHDTGTIAFHAHDALTFGDYQGGRFVACGDDGQRSYSTDGKAWTASAGATDVHSTHVAYGNGVFVAVDGTAVVVSRDGGATFSRGGVLAAAAQSVIFAQRRFTAVGDGHVLTSADGAAWTDHTAAGVQGGMLAYGHGTYMLVGGGGLRRSSDGLSFGPVAAKGSNGLEAVAFGPSP